MNRAAVSALFIYPYANMRLLHVIRLVVILGVIGLCAVGTAQKSPGDVSSPPRLEALLLHGYSKAVFGRWLGPDRNVSGVPLGGLGTGFLELRPDGRIHDTCLRNDWLKPRPPQLFRLSATLGAGKETRTVVLLAAKGDPSPTAPARYLGHYPVVDMEFAGPTTVPADIRLRAFSPFVPGDADLSNIPAAVFSVRIKNADARPLATRIELQFAEPGGGDTPAVPFRTAGGEGIQVTTGRGSGYAISVAAAGWNVRTDMPASTYGDVTAHAAAVGRLKPGEENTITFVVSWYTPQWTTSDGRRVRNRYALRFADARGVATFVLERAAVIEQRIAAWQQEIYGRQIPDWMKDGLVNSLYVLARNSMWVDDGRLLVNESFTGRPVTESVTCRFNGSYPLLLLFPDQEKRVIRAIAKLQAENGEIPFGVGAPAGIDTGMFGAQRPILSTEFVLMCWRDFVYMQDMELLVGLYPRIKRALQFAMTLDTDGDGLINEASGSETGFPSNQYYDNWPWFGTSSYTAGIGLAALRAGEEAAKRCGDREFAVWCRERYDRGVAVYDELLWNGRYYRLYSDPEGFRQSETCLADQLCGQMAAWLSDLGDLLPADHVRDALQSIGRLNAVPTARGVVSGMKADGTPDGTGGVQSREVVFAETCNFVTAALMVAAQKDDDGLRKSALGALERAVDSLAVQGATWDQPFVMSAKDGASLSGHHYTGNLSLWAVPFGLEGGTGRKRPARNDEKPGKPGSRKEGGLISRPIDWIPRFEMLCGKRESRFGFQRRPQLGLILPCGPLRRRILLAIGREVSRGSLR